MLLKGQIDRWVFTEEHVAMLEASFLKNPYVSSSDRSSFAQMIGCGEDKVRNWFSRRRTKAKLEGASNADQIQDDEDMDDQESASKKPPRLVTCLLTPTEIMKKMTRILRGNAIMAASDVESVVNLMGLADDRMSRKYIVNALMHTNSAPVISEFVSSRGPQIMRGWLMAAKATPNDQDNKEIMLRIIAVWAKLPFNYDLLKEFELGKAIRSFAKDKNLDDDVVVKASQLEKHWRRLVTAEIGGSAGDGAGSKSSSSGSKSESSSNKRSFQGNGPDGDRARIKRDRDDGLFSQSSDMKLPKFNKGKTTPAQENKKTHIVANAGFFKELMAPPPAPSRPPPPPTTKASATPLSVTTTAPSKTSPHSQVADSIASPSKPTPSPPTTPTTPTAPTPSSVTPNERLSPVATEPAVEEVSALSPEPTLVSEPVPPSAATPTAAAAAVVASLIESQSLPVDQSPAEPVKPPKPKKVVRFKAAHELEMIRYIERYNDAEEKEMEAALLRGDMWQPPPMLVLDDPAERGSASKEKDVQEKREAETLSVNYVREAYIPMSPAEPDPDPMDTTTSSTSIAVPPVFEASADHSAILMNSLAFLTQVASSSGSTSTAPATGAAAPIVATPIVPSQPAVDQSQVSSMFGTAGAAYGTASGYGTGSSGYGTGGSGYGMGALGYGAGASGYGAGAAGYGAGVGSYGTYGAGASYATGASSYGTGTTSQAQPQPQQQSYPYQGFQQLQQANQAAYNPTASQGYNFQQQYPQAAVTSAPAAPNALATTANMDPLALIEMLKQVTGTQQQQQQQQQQGAGQSSIYGYSQNWPNTN
ncbi:hypothetical protein EC991_001164 [Linnemannia zychae]|nr:hypothetical protein EC991_001164 [Linnemannia zychae]